MGLAIGIFLICLAAAWIIIRLIYIPFPDNITLFFGAVRSGKTMFLTKSAIKCRNKGFPVYTNYPIKYPGIMKLDKLYFGVSQFPPGSCLFFDEASLNGYDNREFKNNFKDNNALEFFKLIGHFKNRITFSNQGYDELDKKIRTLTTSLYLVKRLPLVSIAVRIYMNPSIDEMSHQVTDQYHYANLFRLLFDPRCLFFVLRSKYGQYYDSWSHPEYPGVPSDTWLSSPPSSPDTAL